jgi:hypothetical protein
MPTLLPYELLLQRVNGSRYCRPRGRRPTGNAVAPLAASAAGGSGKRKERVGTPLAKMRAMETERRPAPTRPESVEIREQALATRRELARVIETFRNERRRLQQTLQEVREVREQLR